MRTCSRRTAVASALSDPHRRGRGTGPSRSPCSPRGTGASSPRHAPGELPPDEVSILRVMVGRTNLNQPLEEDPRFAVFPAPDLLEHFMGLEEETIVEEPDRLLDRIQAAFAGGRHRRVYGARRNQLSRGRSLADATRAGASSVLMISGAYVPRSVTTVVTSGPGVTSNRFPARGPGHEAASKRASNFKVSHATYSGFSS